MSALVQLYQIWPSKNRFYFKGKLMAGPEGDFGLNLFTWLAIIIIGSPFLFYINPVIFVQLHPAVAVCAYVIYIGTIVFLSLTQFSDPGIIPRKEILERVASEDIKQKYIAEQATDLTQRNKICSTCQIVKPPRSHHCSECDNCVLIFDHHCPFVNNCIGQNNYSFFVSFIFCLVFTCMLLAAEFLCFVILIATDDEKVQKILIIILLIPFGIVIFAVTCLFAFHLCLCISGRTTKEQLKDLKPEDDDVFSKCKRTKSLFNLRQVVKMQDGDIRKNDPQIVYGIPRNVLVPEPDIERAQLDN